MGGSSKKQTVGYFYSVGMHMVLCKGPIDKVTEIQIDERVAWQGDSNVGATIYNPFVPPNFNKWPPLTPQDPVPGRILVHEPELFGGKDREGGVVGYVDIMQGELSQGRNDYLQSVLGAVIPAYRGVVSAVLRRVYMGMNPYLKPWKFRIQRLQTGWDGNTIWYQEKAAIGEDMNPAHIIYEVLTCLDPDWGMAYSASEIDDAQFRSIADTLHSEGMGLSFLWSKEVDGDRFIETVLRHINGDLLRDRNTGKFIIKLFRADYDPANVRVLGTDTVLRVIKSKTTEASELSNQIVVKYWDRETGKNSSITVQNLALIDIVGGINSTTVNYPGCCTQALAGKLAARDLTTFSTPLTGIEVECNKRAYDLQRGDVVKFDLAHENIPDVVYRVIDVKLDKNNRFIRLELTQDVFSTPEAVTSGAGQGQWTDPVTTPLPATLRKLYELSYYDAVKAFGQGEVDALTEDDTSFGIGAARPSGDTFSFTVHDVDDGEDRGVLVPISAGTLQNAIDKDDTVITFSSVQDVQDISVGEMAAIGDERVMVSAIDGINLTIVRGVEDTVPQDHAAGAVFMLLDDVTYDDPEQFVTGQTVNIKLLTLTGKGELPVDDAPTDSLTFVGRQGKPYPPADVKVDGAHNPGPISRETTGTLDMTFAGRNRLQQTAGYLGWYDPSHIDLEPNTEIHYNLRKGATVFESGSSPTSPVVIPMSGMPTGQDTYTLEVWAERDGNPSMAIYSVDVDLTVTGFEAVINFTNIVNGYIYSGSNSIVSDSGTRTADFEAADGPYLLDLDVTPLAKFDRCRVHWKMQDNSIVFEEIGGTKKPFAPTGSKEVRVYFCGTAQSGDTFTVVGTKRQVDTPLLENGFFTGTEETLTVNAGTITTQWFTLPDTLGGTLEFRVYPYTDWTRNRLQMKDTGGTITYASNGDTGRDGVYTIPPGTEQIRMYVTNSTGNLNEVEVGIHYTPN